MAFQSATATDHEDLYAKLIAFLTTDPELVLLGQNWDVVWESPSNGTNETDIVLRGPGLADTDSIYIGLRQNSNVGDDSSEILIYGMTGIVPSALSVDSHINVVTQPVKFFLKTTAMDYWFVASGRRFMGAVQVNTVYESFYAGFFLPYGNPLQYNYPLYIGGTAGHGLLDDPIDFRSIKDGHAAFPYSSYTPTGSFAHNPSAWFLDPAGSWLRVAADVSSSGAAQPDAYSAPKAFGWGNGLGAELDQVVGSGTLGYYEIWRRMNQMFGGGFTLTPVSLVSALPSDQAWGVLDGVYTVPGRGQTIENIIGAGNYAHLVLQNAFRTDLQNWFVIQIYPEGSNSELIEDSNSV